MRVKRLELLGFKSFATKTTVQFEPGVTAIVGPNGSGKSNIVDAIRWVLGEHNPRDVRAPRLEDVIFNGTDTKAPLSMAEISLTIENERGLLPIAFTEIEVTRRVYRSGESEYLINQSACRLKDIQELFLGTGLGGGTYAIIEQGHIDLILSSKPEERRRVFEEASGIARYLSKKQETLRRLNEVEQDLVRAADITQEVKRQVAALERQAAKARHYKTQWEQLKAWELRVAAAELRQGAETHQALTQQVESLRQQHGGLEAKRQQLLVSLEGCQAAVTAAQAQLQDARTRVIESSAQTEQHTSQLALKTRWMEELAQQREQLAREAAQLEGRQAQLGEQCERLQAQQALLERQHSELLAQRAHVSDALTQLERALAECAAALEQSKASLFDVASEAVHQRNGLSEITLRLQQVDLQVARVQAQHRVVEQRLAAMAAQQQQFERERQTLNEDLSARGRQLTEARAAAHQAQAEHHELMGRLRELRERGLGQRAKVQLLEEMWRRYEGFPESVKAVLTDPSEGMLGLLVDVLDPQPGYEQALEAALGPLAYAILVTDRQALRRCQERLASHDLDAAAFVVLADAPAPSAASASLSLTNGGPGRLIQFLEYGPNYASLVEWLLGPWLVVDQLGSLLETDLASLHPALEGGVHGPWVSKAGERMDGRSWRLRGGRANLQHLVARKRQWEDAHQALETLERDTAAVQQAAHEAEARWQSLVAQEERMARQVEELTPGVNKLDGQLSVTQHESK
ncbi:MAG: AAA family ATPase, partial [Candidatus Omnitrophica bacterium]|nr:AAA family ATPase [Candidatus Omnitrophota bacterium]